MPVMGTGNPALRPYVDKYCREKDRTPMLMPFSSLGDAALRFMKNLGRVLALPLKYKRSVWFILRKRGLKSACNFLFTKYFVADEGGDLALMNPIIARFPAIAGLPFKIETEFTTKCNKRCVMCEHTYWDEKPQEVSLGQFKEMISQFPHLKWINVTGEGSGFLHKDFLEIVEHLRSKDISANFVDEMDFVDESTARRLIELGVNCIWVSMDAATKETYEKLKVGCSFDRALANIRKLLRLKEELGSPFPVISFRYIVNRWNVAEMPKFVELAHSLGNRGEGAKLEFASVLRFKEIEHLFLPEIPKDIYDATIEKAKELGVEVSFNHIDKLPCIDKCAAWHEPYIMIGGYVLPCCAVLMSNKRPFLRKHAFGNLYEKPFEEIWNSERYRKFRELVPKKEGKVPILCAGCRAFDTREREEKYGITEET